MNEFVRLAARGGETLAEIARSPRYYRGWLDVIKANWLRVTENRVLRPLLSRAGHVTAIHVRGNPDPVYLRGGNSDFHVLREIFETSEYGRVLELGLPADATIIDLGANIGLMAIYMNVHFPQCRMISVEPDAENCRMFRKNCARMLETGRLRLAEGFAAAKDGEASISRDGPSWAFRKVDLNDAERIACFSVPSLCQLAGYTTIDLLKCDIEGSELELFANCSEWIQNVRHLVVEIHGDYGVGQLVEALAAGGGKFRVVEAEANVILLSAVQVESKNTET